MFISVILCGFTASWVFSSLSDWFQDTLYCHISFFFFSSHFHVLVSYIKLEFNVSFMLGVLEGDGKVHGEAPRGNQRVALGDRTNFEAGQGEIEGKLPVQITRRITRSFHAQLLANAQKNNVVRILDNCFSTLFARKF